MVAQDSALCAIWRGFGKKIIYSSNSNGEQTAPWSCSDPTPEHPYGIPLTPYCSKYYDDDTTDNWVGVTCDQVYYCHVTRIELIDNIHLTGTISPLITTLTSLRVLALTGNGGGHIHGPIPSDIGNLAQLTGLFLFSNSLTGTIPRSIDALTSLQYLLLHDNYLNGSVPDTLCQMTRIGVMDLSQNRLTGALPDAVCCLTSLTALYLDKNKIACYPKCVERAPGTGRGLPYSLHSPNDIVPSYSTSTSDNATYGKLAGWLTNIVTKRFDIDDVPVCVPPTLTLTITPSAHPTASPSTSTPAPTRGTRRVDVPLVIVDSIAVGNYVFFLTLDATDGHQVRLLDCSATSACANPSHSKNVPSISVLLNAAINYIGFTFTTNITALCFLDNKGFLYYIQGYFNKTYSPLSYSFTPSMPSLITSRSNFTGASKITFSPHGEIDVCVNKSAVPDSPLPPWLELMPTRSFPNVTHY